MIPVVFYSFLRGFNAVRYIEKDNERLWQIALCFQSGRSLQENPESSLHHRGCKPLSTRSAATSAAFNQEQMSLVNNQLPTAMQSLRTPLDGSVVLRIHPRSTKATVRAPVSRACWSKGRLVANCQHIFQGSYLDMSQHIPLPTEL